VRKFRKGGKCTFFYKGILRLKGCISNYGTTKTVRREECVQVTSALNTSFRSETLFAFAIFLEAASGPCLPIGEGEKGEGGKRGKKERGEEGGEERGIPDRKTSSSKLQVHSMPHFAPKRCSRSPFFGGYFGSCDL
jgi:hypothetical protein